MFPRYLYLSKFDNDIDQAAQALEKKGWLVRLDNDKNFLPTKFRFPVLRKRRIITTAERQDSNLTWTSHCRSSQK